MSERQAFHSFERLRQDLTSHRVDFLVADLDLGITFARIALESGSDDTRARNRRNARKAYDTTLCFLPRGRPTRPERKQINEKLAALKSRLQSLGETF
jgi:hypothetical protein